MVGQISVLYRKREREKGSESGAAVGKLGPDPGPPEERAPLPLPESFVLFLCFFFFFCCKTVGGEGGVSLGGGVCVCMCVLGWCVSMGWGGGGGGDVCVCWGGALLTSTIVFLICALGSIFLRTVDPPCAAFKERSVCVCVVYTRLDRVCI